MITYGFYDSVNHDRRYNALQFGSIFDGIVRDGVFMSIGTCFQVVPSEEMIVLVGVGRAWFDHTWTLNDSPLPMTIPQSEVLLNRIDAIVLDIDQNKEARVNDIILVKGTPSQAPQRPALINDNEHHQYPLAYVLVRAGTGSIRAADITNVVGTSPTPYVTGVLETINIDYLLNQWQDQWQQFFENQTTEIENYNDFWEREWERWYEAQTTEIQDTYSAWVDEWELWSRNYKTMMNDTAEEWKSLWNAWFYTYINQNEASLTQWQQGWDKKINDWFDDLNVMLDGDVATKLAKKIEKLESCCGIVQEFIENFNTEHAIHDILYDNSLMEIEPINDSSYQALIDSSLEEIHSRSHTSQPILDSNGQPIGGTVIFVTK